MELNVTRVNMLEKPKSFMPNCSAIANPRAIQLRGDEISDSPVIQPKRKSQPTENSIQPKTIGTKKRAEKTDTTVLRI